MTKKFYGFSARPLGHVAVELVKDGDTLLTGMVADRNKEFFRSLFREKSGLGILFKIIDGHLEEKSALGAEIYKRTISGRIAFLRFHINDSSYYYMREYIDSFRVLGYDQLYNGLNEPRHGAGAGCSAFGMSFLELINALDPDYTRSWLRDVPVPDRLIGAPLSELRVGVEKVFFSFGWAKDKTPHTHIRLYDPDLMYRWIEKKYREALQDKNGIYKPVIFNSAIGLERDYKQLCKPQLPMFAGSAAR